MDFDVARIVLKDNSQKDILSNSFWAVRGTAVVAHETVSAGVMKDVRVAQARERRLKWRTTMKIKVIMDGLIKSYSSVRDRRNLRVTPIFSCVELYCDLSAYQMLSTRHDGETRVGMYAFSSSLFGNESVIFTRFMAFAISRENAPFS